MRRKSDCGADYWFAHMSPRVTSNWSALAPQDRARRGAPSNAAALRDEVIAAKERVMRALMAVGPRSQGSWSISAVS